MCIEIDGLALIDEIAGYVEGLGVSYGIFRVVLTIPHVEFSRAVCGVVGVDLDVGELIDFYFAGCELGEIFGGSGHHPCCKGGDCRREQEQ